MSVRARFNRPKFVVVGAMKAGTTSVYELLRSHPDVGGPRRKELHWFSLGGRSEAWLYDMRFLLVEGAVVGEASPSYAEYPRFGPVAERMAAAAPDAKLVYCLRDPLERMVSHYRHEVIQGRERRPIQEAADDLRYLIPSLYGLQLDVLRASFPAEQIALVSAHSLADPTSGQLAALHRFVGVEPDPGAARPGAHHYVSAERDPVPGAATALTGSPLGRIAKSIVPSGIKDEIRRRLATGDDADRANDLMATAEQWVPPAHVRAALIGDRESLASAMVGCPRFGVDRSLWAEPQPPVEARS